MAKAKSSSKFGAAKSARAGKPAKAAKSKGKSAGTGKKASAVGTKARGLVNEAKKSVTKLASNPAVSEVVAATLVAAAAALRDPNRARALAGTAAEELKALSKKSQREGSALWKLALDVAARSLDSFGAAAQAAPKKKKIAAKKKK